MLAKGDLLLLGAEKAQHKEMVEGNETTTGPNDPCRSIKIIDETGTN